MELDRLSGFCKYNHNCYLDILYPSGEPRGRAHTSIFFPFLSAGPKGGNGV